MAKTLPIPKTSAMDVARGILSGIERGDFEIFPDPNSLAFAEMWTKDPAARRAS